MPKPFDAGDTRYLAERTREAQREQHRVVKATSAVLSFAALPVGKRANVRKVAVFNRGGLMRGLVEASKVRSASRVSKADASSPLQPVYNSTGALIGAVDPANLEQLAAGESFVFDAKGTRAESSARTIGCAPCRRRSRTIPTPPRPIRMLQPGVRPFSQRPHPVARWRRPLLPRRSGRRRPGRKPRPHYRTCAAPSRGSETSKSRRGWTHEMCVRWTTQSGASISSSRC